jgi:hypothetical protein
MNYLKIYINLVKNNNPDRETMRTEKHHIFPVSIFGSNNRIVKLTIREHFVAHKLLYMIFKKKYGQNHPKAKKMLHALRMMMFGNNRQNEIMVSSYWFALLREHNSERSRGENNPAKRPFSRKKISESKKGKKRDDLKGKSYFGASAERVSVGIEKMIQKKTGMKIDYPKNRNSPPCSEEKARKISEARAKTKDKFVNMNEEEFVSWICEQKLYAKDGKRKNSNVTRVLMWRGIPLNEYYTCEKSD